MKPEEIKKIVALRHELHMHAELSQKEHYTKTRLIQFIKENTTLDVVDRGAWFYAYKKCRHSEKDPIAFRADFDAVPISETCDIPYKSINESVGHKCGHDGHSAVLVGLALELEQAELKRDCYLIFQHAEEIGQGGEVCSMLIPEKRIAEVYAFHNRSGFERGALVYRRGLTQSASKGLTISMTGRPAHASQPEDGINPSIPIAALVEYTDVVLRENRFKDLVLCTIIGIQVGSKNFGVAASEGEVSMTLRANREDELMMFEKMITDKASDLAKEYGLEFKYRISDPFPETRNHDVAIDKVLRIAKEKGIKTVEMEQPWRASEDFGYYTKKCSGAMFYIGNGENYPMVHTQEYDFCDEIIPECVEIFYELAID